MTRKVEPFHRSKFIPCKLYLSLFVFLSFVHFPSLAFGEEEKPKPELKELAAWSGLYLGRVVKVDSKYRYVFVRPLEGTGRRRSFYLNSKTIYREKRKPTSKSQMLPGRQVGIRYVRENDISYAEGIFLFEGEVNPREFEMPKKPRAPKKEGEGAKGEGKKAEGEKKSGGGH